MNYPIPETVLYALYPTSRLKQAPDSVSHGYNIPAKTYKNFVMRKQAFHEIIKGLLLRCSVIMVVGGGGIGKTTLIHEISDGCLSSNII